MVADRACVLIGGTFCPGAARTIGRLSIILETAGKYLSHALSLRNDVRAFKLLATFNQLTHEVLSCSPFQTERERSTRVLNIFNVLLSRWVERSS